jgi:acyl-CoA thioester hydrolase
MAGVMVNDAAPFGSLGRFQGAAHHYPVRVYFEDTDLSGVVYHANYLRYMERARSDMLRAVGIDQRASLESGEGVYAVADLRIKYRAPAKLDDDLVVVSTVAAVGAATATIHQAVMRGTQILTDAQVTAAFLTPGGRPRRQPKAWVNAFKTLQEDSE